MNKAARIAKQIITRQPLRPTREHLLIHFVWTLVIAILVVFAIGLALPALVVVG